MTSWPLILGAPLHTLDYAGSSFVTTKEMSYDGKGLIPTIDLLNGPDQYAN